MKLFLFPDSEPPGCLEIENECKALASESSNLHNLSILGTADNRLVNAGAFESWTATARSVKEKYRTKPDKGVKKKYIPKQSN